MLPTSFLLSYDQRQKRSLTQDVIPFLTTSSFSTQMRFPLKQKLMLIILFL